MRLIRQCSPGFAVKFPFVDAVYVASYQTDITTAINFQSDTAQVNLIKVLTEDVEASVAEGMKSLDTLDTYARLAFPDSPAKQRVFGQDTWDKARNDQQKMSKALKLAHSFASVDPYLSALEAKGAGAAGIASLLTTAANIDTKDALQEKAKAGRPVVTEDRINVHNIVWARDRELSIMAELVYRNDAAKRAQYLLYPSTPGEHTTVRVHVVHGAVPQEGATVTLTNTELVARLTTADGNTIFESTNMPDSVDVKVTAGTTDVILENQVIVVGEDNTIEVSIP